MGQKIIDQTPEIWGKTFSTKSETVERDYDKLAESGEYDAVNFIGALTYFQTKDILKELCRIVRPHGHIIFSQRDYIMREQHYEEQHRELEAQGLWKRIFGTEPMPYLPNHPDHGTKIEVQYFVYEVL